MSGFLLLIPFFGIRFLPTGLFLRRNENAPNGLEKPTFST